MSKQIFQIGGGIARRSQFSIGYAAIICIVVLYVYSTSNPRKIFIAPKPHPGYVEPTNSTLNFQKIFAISLPSRTDRQDALTLMSALSGINIEVVPGIRGEDVREKTIPKDPKSVMKPGFAGSWRAHLNTIKRVVDEGISTALIIEDDVDWDIRVREQMQRVLEAYLKDQKSGSSTLPPDWDLLWLGNIGERFPADDNRKIQINDPTVPPRADLSPGFDAVKELPERSRFLHPTDFPACTYAYAVSYAGAQKILYHASLGKVVANFDSDLANNCWLYMNCLSLTPPLFHFDRSIGLQRDSDTDAAAEKHNREPGIFTNVDISVRTVMKEKFGAKQRENRSWRFPNEFSSYFIHAMDLPGQ
ncbi:hypothetical protein ONS95_004081 [Cadophora gregata]|uniref:uncharacterized protein n=1 Tax=Cadophora gregata TaxID=51156 RepID=UPI0026DC6BB3|nr:uncharacterized protein ONS95_004081 [Cadophora gregata]KAK0107389.1 hypothetical protein ONS95_004081 [Cadophora gregata]